MLVVPFSAQHRDLPRIDPQSDARADGVDRCAASMRDVGHDLLIAHPQAVPADRAEKLVLLDDGGEAALRQLDVDVLRTHGDTGGAG